MIMDAVSATATDVCVTRRHVPRVGLRSELKTMNDEWWQTKAKLMAPARSR